MAIVIFGVQLAGLNSSVFGVDRKVRRANEPPESPPRERAMEHILEAVSGE